MSKTAILQLRSHYSVSEGLNQIKDTLKFCKDNHIHSIAITDLDNMYGWVKFYKQARSMGVKPIAGATIVVRIDDLYISSTLLCENNIGYQSLIALLSRAYEKKERILERPIVDYSDLLQVGGLFIIIDSLSPSITKLALAKQTQELESLLNTFEQLIKTKRVFGSLPKIGRESEALSNYVFASACAAVGVPLVASYPVCFASPEDYEAHDVKVCIYMGRVVHDTTRVVRHTKEQYLRTSEQMMKLYADIPQALENANRLAMMCNVTLDMDQVLLPDVSPSGDANHDFKQATYQGFENRAKQLKLNESF